MQKLLLVAAFLTIKSGNISATILPENYPVIDFDAAPVIDQNLANWTEKYANYNDAAMTAEKLQNILADSDPATSQFAQLRFADILSEIPRQSFATNPIELIDQEKLQPGTYPLLPFYLSALMKSKEGQGKSGVKISNGVLRELLKDDRCLTGSASPKKSQQSPPLARNAGIEELTQIRNLASSKNCTSAESKLVTWINRSEVLLESALKGSEAVSDCFGISGKLSRLKFLTSFSPVIENRFGVQGWAPINSERARIKWNLHENEDAKQIFSDIVARSRTEKFPRAAADALFYLAKITTSEGGEKEAYQQFSQIVQEFPGTEEGTESLKFLVISDITKKEWASAASNAEKIISQQNFLAVGDREAQHLGFGLFWAARSRINLGDIELANSYLNRLAKEFYSTYYGALGHYLLEKTERRILAPEPTRGRRFMASYFFSSFEGNDQLYLRRALEFLRLGLREEARCEIKSIQIDEKNDDQQVARILLDYASGKWIDAIRNLNNLNRSARGNLPRGFEQLLFPRRYESEIVQYASKLNLDADFVMALIRQESAFNHEAKSSVGAAGLMQLMPATAKTELARISTDFLPAERKMAALQSLARNAKIENHSDNLAVGIHHIKHLVEKLGNPVYALAGYNANPKVAQKWAETMAKEDLLVFVEQIPYRETRNYVKLILRNYFYYQKWYRFNADSHPLLDKIFKDSASANVTFPSPKLSSTNHAKFGPTAPGWL